MLCIEEGPGNRIVGELEEHFGGYISNSHGGSMTLDLLQIYNVIWVQLVF